MITGHYINLASELERRQAMEKRLADAGLTDYLRFEAVDGCGAAANHQGPLSAGEVGCWLSHTGLLDRHRQQTAHLHVLEDDVIVHRDMARVFETFLAQHAPDAWDLLYTEIFVPHDPAHFKYLREQLLHYRQGGDVQFLGLARVAYAGATSYLVNAASIDRLLELLGQGWHGRTPYDIRLRELVNQNQLRAYVCFPFFSTLSNDNTASSIREDQASRALFDLYRQSFYVDADLEAIQSRCCELNPGDESDVHTAIYLKLVENVVQPSFERF